MAVSHPSKVEHVYDVPSGSGKTTFKLFSYAKDSSQTPVIIENEGLTGSLSWSIAPKPGDIEDITIQVIGKHIGGRDGTQGATSVDVITPFLEQKEILWRSSASCTPPTGLSQNPQGNYTLPFNIKLPHDVTMSAYPGEPQEVFRLPPTLLERGTHASISYDLTLVIRPKRKGMLGFMRSEKSFYTVFRYITRTKPPAPPSALRQVAYKENSPLPGPDVDPEGWKELSTSIKGTAFNTRDVDVTIKLYLALPLSYSKGSALPCFVTIDCSDAPTLALLTAPENLNLSLRQRYQYNTHFDKTKHSAFTSGGYVLGEYWSHINKATLWRSLQAPATDHRCTLQGQINIPATMASSMAIYRLTIDHWIELLPFSAAAFKDASEKSSLLSECIEVVDFPLPGPPARSYGPLQEAEEPAKQAFDLSGITYY